MLPTASIGKVLLLIEVSARLTSREFSGYGILDKTPRDAVGDSGIWQHLQAPSLPVADLATLVGATSDNLATNVLLRQVGLEAVRARTESLGLMRTALLDLVRDSRGPDDAPQLSVGSTAELSWLFAALARGEIVRRAHEPAGASAGSRSTATSRWWRARSGSTRSRTAVPDHGILLVNKTGTDAGVRAEAGALRGHEPARSPTRCRCSSTTTAWRPDFACSMRCARSASTCWSTCTTEVPQLAPETGGMSVLYEDIPTLGTFAVRTRRERLETEPGPTGLTRTSAFARAGSLT